MQRDTAILVSLARRHGSLLQFLEALGHLPHHLLCSAKIQLMHRGYSS